MKTKRFLLAVACAATAFTFSACSSDDGPALACYSESFCIEFDKLPSDLSELTDEEICIGVGAKLGLSAMKPQGSCPSGKEKCPISEKKKEGMSGNVYIYVDGFTCDMI